jgi:hypothetical protein
VKQILLVPIALMLCSSAIQAQKKDPPELGSAVLEVASARLRLGMTKAEVTEKLSGAPITKINENNWVIAASGSLGPTVQFTNGRLNFAERYWTTSDNDIAEALFGVVNALNKEGFSACKVTTYTNTAPDTTVHGVWIQCGEKSVRLTRDTFGGKSYNMVYEQLGGMHDLSE